MANGPRVTPHLAVLALSAAVGLPVFAAGVRLAANGWVPTVDDAIIITRSYDVLSSGSPTLGQSSMGGQLGTTPLHSPGPLLYWLLSVPSRIGPPWIVPVFMGSLNAVLLAIVVLLARRRGGTVFAAATAVGLLLLVRAIGVVVLVEVWNPSAALVPFLVLLFLTWSIVDGDRWLLPAAVLVASFVVQTHLTYLMPVVALMLVTLAAGWGREVIAVIRRRDRGGLPNGRPHLPSRPGGVRTLLLAIAVGAACWIAPLVQQLRGDPGNLTLVARAGRSAEKRGGLDAVRASVGRAIGLPPRWTKPSAPPIRDILEGVIPGPLIGQLSAVLVVVLLGIVALVALRVRDRTLLAAAATGLAALAAMVAVAATLPLDRGLVTGYSFLWFRIAGLYAWLVLGLAGWRWLVAPSWAARADRGSVGAQRAPTSAARPIRPAWLVLAASIATVGLFLPDHDPTAWTYRPADQLGDRLQAATRPGARYMIGPTGPYDGAFTSAMVWRLRTSGREPVLPAKRVHSYGGHYAGTGLRCAGIISLQPPGAPVRTGTKVVATVALPGAPGLSSPVRLDIAPDTRPGGSC